MRRHVGRSWGGHTARLFIAFNSLFLLLVGLVAATYTSHVLQREVTGYVEDTLHQAVVHLDSNLTDARSRIIRLTQMDSVKQCLRLQAPDITQTLAHERVIDQYLGGITLFRPDIEDILIVGGNGYRYNLAKREDLRSDYAFTGGWYQDAIRTDGGVYVHILGPFVQDYYNPRIKGHTAQTPTIAMSMVVFDGQRTPIGAVLCTFDLEAMGQLFVESDPRQNRRIALVSPDGVIVSQSDNARIGEALPLSAENLALLRAQDSGMFRDRVDGSTHLFHFTRTSYPGWKLVSYLPLGEVYASARPVLLLLVPFLLLCLLCNALIGRALSRSIQRPVLALVDSVRAIDRMHLTLIPAEYPYTELQQIAAKFNELLANLKDLIQREYLAQIALGRAQLTALQAQIRPHFLFNTLQMLQTEILCGDPAEADRMIVAFSRLLRYTMEGADREVRLSQEVGYVRDYLALISRRYADTLITRIDIPEAAGDALVPKLLLQPLVENSIKHGFRENPAEGAMITLSAAVDGGTLRLRISDNGCGIPPERLAEVEAAIQGETHGAGIGLANVHRRIRALYGAPYGLRLQSGAEGTTAELLLPPGDAAPSA